MLAAAVVGSGGSASALTSSPTQLLAAFHNALSDEADVSVLTSSPSLILELTAAAAEQGGGGEELPEVLASLDFIENVYTVGGSTVLIGDVLGGDFEPSDITANGLEILIDNENRPSAIGALKAIFDTNNYSAVFEVVPLTLEGDPRQIIFPFMNDFNNAVDVWYLGGFLDGTLENRGDWFLYGDDWVSHTFFECSDRNMVEGLPKRLGFTIQPTPYVGSIGGGAADEEPMAGLGARTWDSVFIGHSNGNNNSPIHSYIRKITLYEKLDNATLQSLTPAPAGAPVNAVLPAMTGVAQVGETLTCTSGTWTGTAPITYGYQWMKYFNNWQYIEGETGNTYQIIEDDIDAYIACRVVATNSVWAEGKASNSSDIVIAA